MDRLTLSDIKVSMLLSFKVSFLCQIQSNISLFLEIIQTQEKTWLYIWFVSRTTVNTIKYLVHEGSFSILYHENLFLRHSLISSGRSPDLYTLIIVRIFPALFFFALGWLALNQKCHYNKIGELEIRSGSYSTQRNFVISRISVQSCWFDSLAMLTPFLTFLCSCIKLCTVWNFFSGERCSPWAL